ncbi:MAG: hypothetical protein KF764_04205 [Labilithrix sp.]|nr:hypothetical protein [Labilithrix sp.]
MPRRRSPLFSAVVLAGASLTQAIVACGGREEPTSDEPASEELDASSRVDADARSSFTPGEAGAVGEPADAGECPDGSERPTPPCALIK